MAFMIGAVPTIVPDSPTRAWFGRLSLHGGESHDGGILCSA